MLMVSKYAEHWILNAFDAPSEQGVEQAFLVLEAIRVC